MTVSAAALLLVALFPLQRSAPGVCKPSNFQRTPDVIYEIPLKLVLSTGLSAEGTRLLKSSSWHEGIKQYFLKNYRVKLDITISSTSNVYKNSDSFFEGFPREKGITVLLTQRNDIRKDILGKMETSGNYQRGVIGFVIEDKPLNENRLFATFYHEMLHGLQSDHEVSDRTTSIMKPDSVEVSGYSVAPKSPHPTVALRQFILQKLNTNSQMPLSFKNSISTPASNMVASVDVAKYLTRDDLKNMPLLHFRLGLNQHSIPTFFAILCVLVCFLLCCIECLS